MRETRSSGSVRGASGNGRPYRERVSPVAVAPGEGLLTEPTADARACRWELVKMPRSRPLLWLQINRERPVWVDHRVRIALFHPRPQERDCGKCAIPGGSPSHGCIASS
jgi:hypothetical protein